MSKALLIKSYTDLTTGTPGCWNELGMATSYIQGIQTGQIDGNAAAANLKALISGVPTPWARAKLFKFAMDTKAHPDPNIGQSGLTQYYDSLLGEWRGLIALLALHSDRMTFSAPLAMDTRGTRYDIAPAFGRMLFSERDIWCDQDALAKDPDEQPFIQLIHYKGQLVDGTSPLTGCFTGVDYSGLAGLNDVSWYRGGKLEDPTANLTPDQLQKLYLFVKNMNSHLDSFETKVNKRRNGKALVDLGGFKQISRKWEAELRDKGQSRLRDKGPVSGYDNLRCPFSVLFESNVQVYLAPDFTFTYTSGENCRPIGDVQGLLSRDKAVVGWTESATARPKLRDAAVYFLQVKNAGDGTVCYFSVPLSEMGIEIFQHSLPQLLGYSAAEGMGMTAQIDGGGDTLTVAMTVEIDGQPVALANKEYHIEWVQSTGHVILWPDFVADTWNKYYLYTEYTADARQRFLPIFRHKGQLLRDADGHLFSSDTATPVGMQPPVAQKRLATYPAGQGEDLPRYDIFAFDKPACGLLAMVKQNGREGRAGYLMVRPSEVKDLTTIGTKAEAVVGIDFGSNNTCIYYNAGQQGAQPVEFDNCRVMLVGQENIDAKANASINELLFFTNYPAPNGQVKSWLHEHDPRYNPTGGAEEVAGGVPVNRPNVEVREMDQYQITTQAGILHYNMKWLSDDKGLLKKRAFLKSLWLQVCASLYKRRIRPAEIVWSHPGAMMEADINDYAKIMDDLVRTTPLTGRAPKLSDALPTEAEAVCSFALSQDFGLTRRNMILGIDVGGSTSDILILAKDPAQAGRETLMRESSVRLAAGAFFDAVVQSETFREALVNYHESCQGRVFVPQIKDVLTQKDKAPYVLGNIFDQLKTGDDYDDFYDAIDREAKFVFTIPAYVTGLLLFYAGMLVGKAVGSYHLDEVNQVDIMSFGKGGRIFHWLRRTAGERAMKEYYAKCLNRGLQVIVAGKEVAATYRDQNEQWNKAEVARGLCAPKQPAHSAQNPDTDICGETGVRFCMPDGSMQKIAADEEIGADYFADAMRGFDFTDVANFSAFMDIFIEFVSQKTKLYPNAGSELRADLADLPGRIASAVANNDEEYKKALRAAETMGVFHYHQPIIIAEGICFLSTLIRKAFDQ